MSGGKFIANKNRLLSDVIKKILPTTDRIDFLVGFFYFSGFEKIYKEVEKKQLRVLVGMDIELDMKHKVKEILKINRDENDVTRDNFIGQLKEAFNKSDLFDNKDSKNSIEIFIEKIVDGSLEIRKTIEPNHSKLYLFHEKEETNHNGDRPGVLISGSSNFSHSGLSGRHELNVRFDDKNTFTEGKEIFDYIWEEKSIPITDGGEEDKVVKMLKEETWLKVPTPYYCYIRLLVEYFGLEDNSKIKTPKNITKGAFMDLEYQIDAIREGLAKIKRHNGVIVADVVGLGKSVIGSALIRNLDEKAIIIAPPHLKDQWEHDYKEQFNFSAKVFSSGKIKEALDYDNRIIHKAGIVLIDEAHKYKNSDTNDYGYLYQLCQGKKVILLTATPFNNAPDDIFNLVKFFQIPKKSTLMSGAKLIYEFKSLQKKYKILRDKQRKNDLTPEAVEEKIKDIADRIRNLIEPVLIRRSRIDLEKITKYKEDIDNQGIEFSDVNPPKTINYDLRGLKKLYVETLNDLTPNGEVDTYPFKGVRYKPVTYIKKEHEELYKEKIENVFGYSRGLVSGRQVIMVKLMKRLLVSRFESSIAAFKISIDNFLNSAQNIKEWTKKHGAVPVVKKTLLPTEEDLKQISSEDLDEELEENKVPIDNIDKYLSKHKGFAIKLDHLESNFLGELDEDISFLQGLKDKWDNVIETPKVDEFKDRLKERLKENPSRKIVVFSQYRDTIKHLEDNLKDDFRVLSVTGSNRTGELKKKIKLNFDAGVEEEYQEDDYDILLATDAISEGYNLHRAGIIFNYDIPYNPTRVIQRIGRINRINKKVFDELFIYNYFPSLVGEDIIRIKEISTLKIAMIKAILGDDTQVLTGDEPLESFYKNLIEKDNEYQETENWDTKYINIIKELKDNNPEILENAQQVSYRSRVRRSVTKGKKGVLTFAKKGNSNIFKMYDYEKNQIKDILIAEAFQLFEAEKSEEPQKVSDKFYASYKLIERELWKNITNMELDKGEIKALDKARRLQEELEDPYFDKIEEVINLGSLPNRYMRMLRAIKKENKGEKIKELKDSMGESKLEQILRDSKDFDNLKEVLILSEEF